MTRPALLSLAFAAALVALPARAADKKPDPAADGYTPLFNGTDLTGWVNVNCAPGTFSAKGGEIVTTGVPTGFLRTDRQYENFVLEMDWMHVNKTAVGNSGLFVWGDPLPAVGSPYTRGIEVQVLVNYPDVGWATNHGDLFSIWGAHCKPDRPHPKGYERCLPSENRCKGGGQWNHYKVIANDGVIKLHVNGKEVSGVSQCTPRKGYLALESEGAKCHFKNIQIKELPSTNPKPDEVAKVWEGHKSLFTGVDLSGWKTIEGAWKTAGGHLVSTGKGELATEKKFGACELMFDWKVPAGGKTELTAQLGGITFTHLPEGRMRYGWKYDQRSGVAGVGKINEAKPGAWNRTILTFDGKTFTIRVNGEKVRDVEVSRPLPAAPVTFASGKGTEIMNVFTRELTEK